MAEIDSHNGAVVGCPGRPPIQLRLLGTIRLASMPDSIRDSLPIFHFLTDAVVRYFAKPE